MSLVVESALSVFIERVVDGLAKVWNYLDFFGKEDKKIIEQINKLKETLTFLRGVLEDAQKKKATSKAISIWLMNLEDLAYNVEDILEHFNYAIKLPQKKKTLNSSLKSLWESLSTEPCSMLESITSRLDEIKQQKELLGLLQGDVIVVDVYPNRHAEGSIMLEADVDVYGRDQEKRDIIVFLETSEQEVAVYPIVGMGGIGKTTLARYAFNHELSQKFVVKSWISVSKGYDRERIYESILTYAGDLCSVKDPNALHKKVEQVLADKKFLIVLDDLWEIGIREWD